MKTSLGLLIGLCATACIAAASAVLLEVPFATEKERFEPGDKIVIEHVFATSPKLGVGDTVVVKGHYLLRSASTARIALFATHEIHGSDAVIRDKVSPTQTLRVEGENGSYELSCEITYTGDLHVSFFPSKGGESFGTVYFCAATKKH